MIWVGHMIVERRPCASGETYEWLLKVVYLTTQVIVATVFTDEAATEDQVVPMLLRRAIGGTD